MVVKLPPLRKQYLLRDGGYYGRSEVICLNLRLWYDARTHRDRSLCYIGIYE